MNEEFYYSKKFAKSRLIGLIVFLGIAIICNVSYFLRDWSVSWRIFSGLVWILFCLYYLIRFIIVKNNPSVIITEQKMVAISPFFLKHKIGFEQIISTAIIGDKIKIRFRKPNNNESVVSIYIGGIEGSERLVELLKQRIKFE